ncbi:MAG TPA: dihydrofolate reductase [Lacipirellulaceae bacterium]|nr:dihydrofolate reductase [Lacipirellulaceae bacterium]
MRLSIIAAVAANGVIGREGRLPWQLSTDLQRFKRLTMGHTIIMGRRTWESIGRPLPGRRTIVVTRQSTYRAADGVLIANSLDEALRAAEAGGESEAFVIGGAELFREALSEADRLFFTEVAADVEGDTYFPMNFDTFEWDAWVCVETEAHAADSKNEYAFVFVTFERGGAKITGP